VLRRQCLVRCGDGDPPFYSWFGKDQPVGVVATPAARAMACARLRPRVPPVSLATPPCLAPCTLAPVNIVGDGARGVLAGSFASGSGLSSFAAAACAHTSP